MKIALAQLNPVVGDLAGNCQKILEVTERAVSLGADLVVCSELCVCGYPPKDLLLREGFAVACDQAVQRLVSAIPAGIGVIVGHPTHWHVPVGRIANAASLIADGKVLATVHKLLLPNYDVFDERRYFRPADRIAPVMFRGLRLGLHICEDAWWGERETFHHNDPISYPDPVAELAAQGVDVLINVSASPFAINKAERRDGMLRRHATRHRVPFVFVNQIGGNDDLVFDGESVVLNASGESVAQLRGFAEDLQLIDLAQMPAPLVREYQPEPAQLLDALILGLKDYMGKSGFTGCVLGLSGGVDSTLAAYIAAQACGPTNVHGIMMPSRYSTGHSVDDAVALADRLGIEALVVPIDAVHQAYESLPIAGNDLAAAPAGLADQNLQARIRGAIVMIRSNHHGWLPLATGNKSELAVGYCTLYGDMAGGFAVLADLFKKDVYAICRYINDVREGREVIPRNVLVKPPSAELAPNQFDQDSLPPYPVLDGILEGLIEREESVATLGKTFPLETVRWVARKLDRNEYKRRQMPPGIKLSARAFGSGRRMPMAARFEIE
jgi:NAD+ synthase (glutamine-hydrolysing)